MDRIRKLNQLKINTLRVYKTENEHVQSFITQRNDYWCTSCDLNKQ